MPSSQDERWIGWGGGRRYERGGGGGGAGVNGRAGPGPPRAPLSAANSLSKQEPETTGLRQGFFFLIDM